MMTALYIVAASTLTAFGVLLAFASSDPINRRDASGLITFGLSAFAHVVAAATWVIIGLRMAGV